MEDTITQRIEQSRDLKSKIAEDKDLVSEISSACRILKSTLKKGGLICLCGNGGSACDAMHFYEELVGRYKKERDGIKAVHFLDSGYLTCWANDYSFEDVFARQVRTFGAPENVLVAITTSGNSPNVVKALKAARDIGMPTIGLLGKGGGEAIHYCDAKIVIPSDVTERIQEAHIMCIHILCESLENDWE